MCRSFVLKAIYVTLGAITVALVGACSPSHYGKTGESYDRVQMVQGNGIYKVNYQLSEDGCTTGIQEVFGTSKQDVISEFCKAMQDDDFNNKCAQNLREVHFNRSCTATGTPATL